MNNIQLIVNCVKNWLPVSGLVKGSYYANIETPNFRIEVDETKQGIFGTIFFVPGRRPDHIFATDASTFIDMLEEANDKFWEDIEP